MAELLNEELVKNLESMSLEELDSMLEQVGELKNDTVKGIVDIQVEEIVPERISRGIKNK